MRFSMVRLGAALFTGAIVFANAASVEAGWGSLGGSSGGSSGAYAASYGSGGSSGYSAYSSVGGSSGGSSGHPGILSRMAGRFQAHMAAKHARHAARRASYGSSGYVAGGSSGYTAYSSTGGSSGTSYRASYSGGSSGAVRRSSYASSGSAYSSSYGSTGSTSYGSTGSSSYGSTGSSYGSAGGVYYGASNDSSAPVSSLVSEVSGDAVYLTVAVPSSAKVFVNGKETTSAGSVREFVSRGLKPNKTYRFEIKAEVEGVDGEMLVESKSVVVSAGEREQLDFAFVDQARPIQTAVTLNVPEDAQVLLAGNPTKATGTSRTFRTSQLSPGQSWDEYEIEVRVGDEVKRKSIRLIAGDNLQLTFAFEDAGVDKLAAR